MSLLQLLFGKPTQDDWDRVRDVKSLKTWKVVRGGIGVDAVEIMASPHYQEAVRQVRNMEADHSWAY
ncbi:hypothetical protein B7453_24110 [Pseudomonas sp. IB20]|uniref:hypothetical protein n=1 Tax=Pseudomonas TaxID=286 RepID=UPI000B9FC461|nr:MULTISPECIES: hypothetical protein [unclassified Pseudomonas]MCV2227122.1 hypothetical protein [Pseudomonas sp. AU10]OZO01959.1 hypothetical protein B7453_24110 [Pseudomonas sp. IB20]